MSTKKTEGVDQTFRRTWDKEFYEQKALERLESDLLEDGFRKESTEKALMRVSESGALIEREPLKPREQEVDLATRIGKKAVITTTSDLKLQGYYCEVCDCVIKDSMNYLDHINGKKHQRALGHSMRTKRATVEEVKAKLKAVKRRKLEEKQKVDFEARIAFLQDEEKRLKKERKEEKRRKKEEERKLLEEKRKELGAGENSDLLAAMGLPSGFGGAST